MESSLEQFIKAADAFPVHDVWVIHIVLVLPLVAVAMQLFNRRRVM